MADTAELIKVLHKACRGISCPDTADVTYAAIVALEAAIAEKDREIERMGSVATAYMGYHPGPKE